MQSATRCTAAVHDVVVRVYDAAGNEIETYEHKGELKSGEFSSRHVALAAKRSFLDSAFHRVIATESSGLKGIIP